MSRPDTAKIRDITKIRQCLPSELRDRPRERTRRGTPAVAVGARTTKPVPRSILLPFSVVFAALWLPGPDTYTNTFIGRE